MDKISKKVGIDISKECFDAFSEENGHHRFSNDDKGFKSLLKTFGRDCHYVMESTGYYHYRLAIFLSKESSMVSVENALVVKRYIQMRLSKIKTDKADSKLIYEYACSQEAKPWKCPEAFELRCESLLSCLKFYDKQRVALKNKIQGEESMGKPSSSVIKSLKSTLTSIDKQYARLEAELHAEIEGIYAEELALLQSIPGIGIKTAVFLCLYTDGMKRFETSGQLCSYAGLTPVIRESGKSVRGRPRMSKVGDGKLRRQLFMCSFNAILYNKSCREMYRRMKEKGKSGKVALIAVCSKLLKQAFRILKSGKKYDENHISILT